MSKVDWTSKLPRLPIQTAGEVDDPAHDLTWLAAGASEHVS
jgi:hypothetical protein